MNCCARSRAKSEHEKYRLRYEHLKSSDRIVADCFDGWARSSILLRILMLRREGLLTDEHLSRMSEDTRDSLETLSQLEGMEG